MIVKKVLEGSGAAASLPFALSKCREWETWYGDNYVGHETFKHGGNTVSIKQVGDVQYVLIKAGVFAYEFFTSEHVGDRTLGTPGHENGIANTWVCGSAVRMTDRKGKARGVHSSVFTPIVANDDPWIARDCEAGTGKASKLITWGAWQNQKFFEHITWPKGTLLMSSTQAQAPGWNSQCGWLSGVRSHRIINHGIFTSDFGLDVPPTIYSGGLAGAPDLGSPLLFWRHASTQTVGNKRFFICTDNAGRFMVYPVKDYGVAFRAIPADQYKLYTPPYPTWVTVPSVGDDRVQLGHWLWAFNRDGTKCVACPFNSVDSEFYKSLDLPDGAILPEVRATIAPAEAIRLGREDHPGLVEFGITITITGPLDMDFDVTFTLLRNCYSITDNRWIVDAAYTLPDVDKTMGLAEDTLVTAEIECYVSPGDYHAGPENAPGTTIETVQAYNNLTSFLVLNANDDGLAKTEQVRIQMWTPQAGRFLTLAGYRAVETAGPPHNYRAIVGWQQPLVGGGTTNIYTIGPTNFAVPAPAQTQSYGGLLTYIFALELRTLSVLYEQDDLVTGTGKLVGLAYKKEFHRQDFPLLYSTVPAATAVPTERVPASAHYIHQDAWQTALETSFGQGFNVHPKGHWSLTVNAELQLNGNGGEWDWISVRQRDGTRTRYKHKELFNAAYNQTRDYSFYQVDFPGRVYNDLGSFRTQGVWVDG